MSAKNTKSPMVSNANRYELANAKLLADMSPWKRKAILDDLKSNPESRFVTEFARSVIELAESDAKIFVTQE